MEDLKLVSYYYDLSELCGGCLSICTDSRHDVCLSVCLLSFHFPMLHSHTAKTSISLLIRRSYHDTPFTCTSPHL